MTSMLFGRVTNRELDFIRSIVGTERMSIGESILDLHGKDESFHPKRKPDVVVWPKRAEEVSLILKMANDQQIPVTPWGAGTSLEGNPIPVEGGIVIDFQQMNRILHFMEEDLQIGVEAGVVYRDLNQYLSRRGLFFPPDPYASSTIGGMVANNASGVRTVKYGSTKEFVLNMTFVLSTGEIVRAGTGAMKSTSGYDLCRLMVGSEGTLGMITEVTLRLLGIPPEMMAAVARFETIREATDTVFHIIRSGLSPAALELMDGPTVRMVNRYKNFNMGEDPTLFIECHGTSAVGLKEELEVIKEICSENRCLQFDSGIGRDERARLWEARYNAHESIKANYAGHAIFMIDTAVPISKYPVMVEHCHNILSERNLKGYFFGHAGSGNLHLNLIGDPEDRSEWARVQTAGEEMIDFAIRCGGTSSGEHGIGIGKRKFMAKEHGEGLRIMRRIKECLDPNGIMNPGKIFE
jgi:D-lactate dehydrogenase (cytochrome)